MQEELGSHSGSLTEDRRMSALSFSGCQTGSETQSVTGRTQHSSKGKSLAYRQQILSALQGNQHRQRDDILAEHGQVNLTNQEGHEEVDADGDALSRRASLDGVHLRRYQPSQRSP